MFLGLRIEKKSCKKRAIRGPLAWNRAKGNILTSGHALQSFSLNIKCLVRIKFLSWPWTLTIIIIIISLSLFSPPLSLAQLLPTRAFSLQCLACVQQARCLWVPKHGGCPTNTAYGFCLFWHWHLLRWLCLPNILCICHSHHPLLSLHQEVGSPTSPHTSKPAHRSPCWGWAGEATTLCWLQQGARSFLQGLLQDSDTRPKAALVVSAFPLGEQESNLIPKDQFLTHTFLLKSG